MLAKGLGGECLKLYKTISVMLAILFFLPKYRHSQSRVHDLFPVFFVMFCLAFPVGSHRHRPDAVMRWLSRSARTCPSYRVFSIAIKTETQTSRAEQKRANLSGPHIGTRGVIILNFCCTDKGVI